MTGQQQRRVEILARLEAGALSSIQAAELLGVSDRQVRRLRDRSQQDGMAAVIHGSQGRAPANRTDRAVVARLHELVGEGGKYHGLNVCHLQELLGEHEEIRVGRSTLGRPLSSWKTRCKLASRAVWLVRRA